jgi:hypothetical protein
MRALLAITFFVVLVAAAASAQSAQQAINTGMLLEEMKDLDALARFPKPAFRTIQFSSYDRRSTTPEAPGWLSNADGFGGEPIPGFMKMLWQPTSEKPGLFVVADVQGPGAIVRGWSAGMKGVLRVYVDTDPQDGKAGEGKLIWEGSGYDFLARRSVNWLERLHIKLDTKNAFVQQDADYLPIPFARGLKITWEGRLDELHFYHVQVRRYPAGTAVQTFDPKKDLKEYEPQLRAAVAGLTQPGGGKEGVALKADIGMGQGWSWSPEKKGPGAIRELSLRVHAADVDKALRGCLLRISFDGSQRPQVEAPLGDFFASGPGINPFASLPISVAADGTMACRFVMPYRQDVRVDVVNHAGEPVQLEGHILASPWKWDDDSMYFHAKWRVDPNMVMGAGAIDLPYAVVVGKGVFVGCAAIVMNPSGVPTAAGNWWGEGDEKIMVDGETTPSTFGTGSEDYFNYSWSCPDLFGNPYCGQPLDSGPESSGFISNHRFQIMDAIPFDRSIAVLLEFWGHTYTSGVSYARVAYYYARPDSIDDHRGLMPADLKIQHLPKRRFNPLGAATGAKAFRIEALEAKATAGRVEVVPMPVAMRLQVTSWQAEKGAKLAFSVPFDKDGRCSLHLIAIHQPGGAVLQAAIDGKPLTVEGGANQFALRSAHAPRNLNVNFQPVDVKAGKHEITLECVEPGPVGLDLIWVRPEQ